MRKLLVALATFCSLFPSLTARAVDAACPAPRCFDVEVPDPLSDVPDSHVRVILPAGDDGTRTYPVLYLLHGAGDTYKTWTQNTDVLAFTAAYNVIVVMPDSGRNSAAGWYSDWHDGSRKWETFHTNELIEWVDANLHSNGVRAIAGLSMGGFGAMHDAARHPDLYRAVASFSGAVDTMYGYPLSGPGFTAFNNQFGTPDDRVWGNQFQNEQNWRANNPTDLASNLAGKTVLIATGNGLPGGKYEDPANVGGYAIENIIWQMNIDFTLALDRADVAHTDWFYGSGQHSWPYWQDALHWALPQLVSALA